VASGETKKKPLEGENYANALLLKSELVKVCETEQEEPATSFSMGQVVLVTVTSESRK